MQKTISISEEAYDRLRSWKGERRKTFSLVILDKLPAKGTIDAVLDIARTLPSSDDRGLEEIINKTQEEVPPAWK